METKRQIKVSVKFKISKVGSKSLRIKDLEKFSSTKTA